MKKIYLIMLALMLALLTCLTFMGDVLYELGKPVVTTENVRMWGDDLAFPAAALQYDDEGFFAYVLCSEQGYSRVIYTVSRVLGGRG